MGLNESEWGHTGVTRMAGTDGCTMEAPAATAYAVLPVGVDTIRPADQSQAVISSDVIQGEFFIWSCIM